MSRPKLEAWIKNMSSTKSDQAQPGEFKDGCNCYGERTNVAAPQVRVVKERGLGTLRLLLFCFQDGELVAQGSYKFSVLNI